MVYNADKDGTEVKSSGRAMHVKNKFATALQLMDK